MIHNEIIADVMNTPTNIARLRRLRRAMKLGKLKGVAMDEVLEIGAWFVLTPATMTTLAPHVNGSFCRTATQIRGWGISRENWIRLVKRLRSWRNK